MKDNVWSFHYQYRNVNPFMESFRDEKFTTRHKRHNPIPHSWLSSCGKIEIPHSRLRRSWGISISPRLLSHSWGIGISLLWLVVNFQFLHLRLRRSCRNYPVPETFHKWIASFQYTLACCVLVLCSIFFIFLSTVNVFTSIKYEFQMEEQRM